MQPQACHAGELAAATRLQEARPLSACTRFLAIGWKLEYTAVHVLMDCGWQDVATVREDVQRLQDLIAAHDVVFLLTDTRERCVGADVCVGLSHT